MYHNSCNLSWANLEKNKIKSLSLASLHFHLLSVPSAGMIHPISQMPVLMFEINTADSIQTLKLEEMQVIIPHLNLDAQQFFRCHF